VIFLAGAEKLEKRPSGRPTRDPDSLTPLLAVAQTSDKEQLLSDFLNTNSASEENPSKLL
jgi:hypothetical protein